MVNIKAPSGEWIFPLKDDLYFDGLGPAGFCVISIRSGSIKVASSDCPRKICIQSGNISKPGQWIACLPHKIFIQIQGESKFTKGIDTISF